MNTEVRKEIKRFLKAYGLRKTLNSSIYKYIGIEPDKYMMEIEPLFSIRRVAQYMTEEDGRKKMMDIADAWELRMLLSHIPSILTLKEKYGWEKVREAVADLKASGKWIAPKGMEDNEADVSKREPVSLIRKILLDTKIEDDAINGVTADHPQELIEQDDSIKPVNGELEFLPPNECKLAYLREQWRPISYYKPQQNYHNEPYIVLIDKADNTRRIATAYWVADMFVDGEGKLVKRQGEEVFAWIPFPRYDIYDIDAEEMVIPVAMLYGDLRHKYRLLRDCHSNMEKCYRALKVKYRNNKCKIEELENSVASANDYQERIDELEREVLAKAQECEEAKANIQLQGEQICELASQLREARNTSADLPRMRVIPVSKLLELPLVGEKMLTVLSPFLKKYNITIDPNK